ncbi:MAG: hypothetical protein QM734_16325 [Cyclobacteriaceae bacterium]
MLSSFERLIKDRVTSPLFSTFIVSWMLCNWKIFYLTLFIDSNKIYPSNKIEFISTNYLDWLNGLVYPLVSTAFLLFVIPFGEKYVYRTYLYFKKGRQRDREKSEADTLLTIEESAAIRLEILDQTDTHRRQLSKKDDDIRGRDSQINLLRTEKAKLKIHYAAYGDSKVGVKWKEVTQDVAKAVDSNNNLNFTIHNNAFSIPDPAEGVDKDFFMVFERDGVVKNFWAKEHHTVSISDQAFVNSGSERRQI